MNYILIIGAKSDIAKALTILFSENSYNIYLAARNVFEINDFAKNIMLKNLNIVKCIELDILDYRSHLSFYNSLKIRPICAISFVGYLGNQALAQTSFNETKKIIDTNFTGITSLLNIIANDYEKNKSGTIIGLSSVAGDRGRKSNYVYGSAKSAFSTFLSGLRARLHKSNIHVITVKPGFVLTKMTKHIKLPNYLTANPTDVAQDIFNAFKNKKNIIYSKWFWKWIMFVIKIIPEYLFKRIKL